MHRPTTRVLAMLVLLQTYGQLSGAEIAAGLEIGAPTVRRYIATLDDIGIPMTTWRGRDEGCALMADVKLPPMMLIDDEVLALSIGRIVPGGVALSGAPPAVESAKAKSERIIPDSLKHRMCAISETVQLAWPAARRPKPTTRWSRPVPRGGAAERAARLSRG